MRRLTDTKLNDNLTTIPGPVRNFLDLDSGDRVEWHLEEGEVVLRRKGGSTEESKERESILDDLAAEAIESGGSPED